MFGDLSAVSVTEWERNRGLVRQFHSRSSRYIEALRLRGWCDADVDVVIEDAYLDSLADPVDGLSLSTVFYTRAAGNLRNLMRRRQVPNGVKVLPDRAGSGGRGAADEVVAQEEISDVRSAVSRLPDYAKVAVGRWLEMAADGNCGGKYRGNGTGVRDTKYKGGLCYGFGLLRKSLSDHGPERGES